MAIIKIKRGTSDPTAAQVTNIGELAANTSTPKLFLKTATDGTTTPVWIGATIESSPSDWTSATKLATQSAINTTFMPKSGGAFTGDVTLNAQSDLRFADSDSSNWVAFQSPATITANVTWTLPNADGSAGQFLSTNGTGTLSWSNTGTATNATNLSGGAAGSIPYQTAASTTTFLAGGTSGDILTYGGSSAPVWSSGTGTGSPVRASSPTLTTPVLGVATATSINKVAITAPATSATLTIADGKTLTASNTLTFTGTDSSSVAFGAGGTVAYTSNKLSAFASTTSSELAGVISDETGSGALVFGTSPTFTTAIDGGASFGAFASSTTLTVGYSGTSASTTNISTGAVAASTTKVINIGTGGATSSTTNINLGSSNGGTVTVNKDLVVSGDLTVNGTTTTINSTTLTVDDKNIEIGSIASPTNVTADGGGITLKGATDKTFNWVNSTGAWTSSEDLNLASGKVYEINGTTVLSATTLGSGVTGSSLTSVGALASGSLAAGFTTVAATVGGTGQSSYTTGDILYASSGTALSKLSASATAGAILASTGSATAPEYKTISLTNGSVTSGSGTLTLAIQNAAADGSTKGIAAFNSTDFDATSGVITIDTVDGGTY